MALHLARKLVLVFLLSGLPALGAGDEFSVSSSTPEAAGLAEELVGALENLASNQRLLDIASQLVEADPQLAIAHYAMGMLLHPSDVSAQHHLDEAIRLSETASDAERRYIQAGLALREGRVEESIGILETLAADFPQQRLLIMRLAQVYMQAGRHEQALPLLRRAYELDSSTPRVSSFLGDCHLFLNQYAEAETYYREARLKTPAGYVPPFYPYVGAAFTQIYRGEGGLALAEIDLYQSLYESSRGDEQFPPVFIWDMKSRLLQESGSPKASFLALDKAWEALRSSGFPDQTREIWKIKLTAGRGRALALLGKTDEARRELDNLKSFTQSEANELVDGAWIVAETEAFIALKEGEPQKAVALLEAIPVPSLFQTSWLAQAYEAIGQTEKASELYRRLLESNENTLERAFTYRHAMERLAELDPSTGS